MQDGLYLNNVWVSPAEELRLTLQANDLQKPATLQTSYSSAFTLPDSLTVRRITENAEATNSGSTVPFSLLPAYVVQAGITVFGGYARFMEFRPETGWTLNLVDKNKALYVRLDRSLQTLKLDRWTFQWSTSAVIAAAGNNEGYCFPLIDCGAFENGGQAADLLLPAVFVKTLLMTMLAEEGYGLDWPTTSPYAEFLSALVLPMSSARPKRAVSADFVADRQARAGLSAPPIPFERIGSDTTVIMPFGIVDQPSHGYSQGRLGNYRPAVFGYVADTSMRVALNLSFSYSLIIQYGGVEVLVQIHRNGNIVKEQDYRASGPDNIFGLNTRIFELETTVECAAGDRITVVLIVRQYTTLGKWQFLVELDSASVTYAPDTLVRYGDNYPLAANLPDITCLDLLKSVALATCGTYLIDDLSQTLRFVPLTPLVANRAEAQDWSEGIDEGGDCRYTPKITPYAQTNLLAYRQPDEKTTQGNGTITITASALDEKQTLFTLPFGPVPVSKLSVGPINVMPRIELRNIDRAFDGTVTVTDKEPPGSPFWLLVHPTLTQTIDTLETIADVNQKVTVPLRVAWFDVRPDPVKRTGVLPICLSFDDASTNERGLINTFFGGLLQVLERPRTLELMRLLSPTEISVLRLDRLVYIHGQDIGGLALPPTYYYINQVSDYLPDVPSKVTLIAAS